MPKIIYIAGARIPTERAHGIHIMKMCEAFALENEVELITPRRFNRIKEDPFQYHNVKRNFKITRIPCFDLIPFDKYIGRIAFYVTTITFLFFLFFYILFKKADIFYIRDKFFLPLALLKKKFIFEAHTFPSNYFIYSFFLKKVKMIVVITKKLKEQFGQKAVVVPDGVDLTKFEIRNSKFELRKKLSLPQDKKIVLYSGHLYQWKGVNVLAGASQYLSEDIEVYFVGGTEKDIKEFKARYSNVRNVRVVGHRPHTEIPRWLKAADVLVLPNSGKEEISKYWTSPLKMFEYMASERPIVASDLLSIREILNEENAVLVEPDNPEALADSIKEILKNPQLADKISEKAFEDVQNYTWEKRAQKIYEFIGEIGK